MNALYYLLIIVLVGFYFKNLAENSNKNMYIYAILGAIVYIIGFIFTELLIEIIIEFANWSESKFINTIDTYLHIIGGIIFSLILYQYLKRKWSVG